MIVKSSPLLVRAGAAACSPVLHTLHVVQAKACTVKEQSDMPLVEP